MKGKTGLIDLLEFSEAVTGRMNHWIHDIEFQTGFDKAL